MYYVNYNPRDRIRINDNYNDIIVLERKGEPVVSSTITVKINRAAGLNNVQLS